MGNDPLGPYVPWNPPGTFFDGLLQKGMQAIGSTVQSAIAAMRQYMERPPAAKTSEPANIAAADAPPDLTLLTLGVIAAAFLSLVAVMLVLHRTRPRPQPGVLQPVVWRIS